MISQKSSVFLIAVFIVTFYSCRKDKPDEIPQPEAVPGNSGGVYITNEGNFQFGNAKVSYYDIANSTVTEDLYETANHLPLGDVCQSLYLFKEKAYIVVNNSGKVVVVNAKTFVTTATINDLPSPRYFLPVSNSKAYVSNFYGNVISVVDLSSNTKTGDISCSGWTEEMALSYGKVYVTNEQRDKVYVINTLTDVLQDSIQVGYGSNSIREDKNGKLWVLCAGSEQNNIKASLHRINPVSDQVEQSYQFTNVADSPWRLKINGSSDTLYFLNGSVFRMPITSSILPVSAFISEGIHNFYGIGVDPNNGTIYVSDAIDYVQRGAIYRYKNNGTLINTFQASIIPGDFYFN